MDAEQIREALLLNLSEAMDGAKGYWLDSGYSFLNMVDGVSPEEASQRVSSGVGTIAAQVNHIVFYLDEVVRFVQEGPRDGVDWEGSWNVDEVDAERWDHLKSELRRSYAAVRDVIQYNPDWNKDALSGAIAMVAHTAYHIGEVNLGLFAIRNR